MQADNGEVSCRQMGTIQVDIDESHHLVVSRITGELTDQLLRDLAEQILPLLRQGYSHLFDTRGVEVDKLTAAGVRSLASEIPIHLENAPARTAFVFSRAGLYGMGRMYQSLRESKGDRGREIRVFTDYDEAMSWILDEATSP